MRSGEDWGGNHLHFQGSACVTVLSDTVAAWQRRHGRVTSTPPCHLQSLISTGAMQTHLEFGLVWEPQGDEGCRPRANEGRRLRVIFKAHYEHKTALL